MTLEQWATNGWLKAHKTSPDEISALLGVADRDLNPQHLVKSAESGILNLELGTPAQRAILNLEPGTLNLCPSTSGTPHHLTN